MKRHGQPDIIVTDGLRSYPAAMRDLGNLDRRTFTLRRFAALVQGRSLIG